MKVERTEEFTITLDRDQADKLLASLVGSAPARGPLADLYLALGAMLGQGGDRDPDWIGNRPPALAIPDPAAEFPVATVDPQREAIAAEYQVDAVPGCIFASCTEPAIVGGPLCDAHDRNPDATIRPLDDVPAVDPDADAPTNKGGP